MLDRVSSHFGLDGLDYVDSFGLDRPRDGKGRI